MFSRILVANRGEIALRIIRACKEMGIRSVAVYSEADADASYLQMADDAICIGPAAPAQSYLNISRIISAAEVADVDAIHPGYGFLAENSHFADVCRSCNIEFIGPGVEAMKAVGDKVRARKLAASAHVRTVPGSDGPIEDEQEALKIAHDLGFPVIIKAAGGGGGRGMRVSHNDINFVAAVRQARAEADAAFKNSAVYLEKFVERPRHIEVQILADNQGHSIHLWERDCTLQRRYQKLLEETPAPGMGDSLREDICRAALRVVREAGYVGAGTVEFLVDRDDKFYFIEVNARIQVEHPITEQITETDLIKWQIRIAAGEPLTIRQRDIVHRGCAIECRINAEDAMNGFLPSAGRLDRFRVPGGPGVRVDTHCYEGFTIVPYYDSLIAKLIVHKNDRSEAIATMRRALDEFVIEGVRTTIPLHQKILTNSAFLRGKVDTGFVERIWK
ncbi:MAG: acetyl-CoA carboxylase biotin carboxylase subunit [Planctomycetia bacterium]|nr:acetyl-CoA carboxylase biotin carboxylase subunit [Planctomycetia bacterium]